MGRVIKVDTEGESTAALTETGKGRLLSKGYLRDDPAEEYVGEGETTVFVVTNASEGVVRVRDGQETAITPGDGFRTIAVVTDRRVIVLVGNADDGDERIALPLVEVADVKATDGALEVAMRSGETWRIHAGDGEVETVVGYVHRAAGTWTALEDALNSVKWALVSATAHHDTGDFEAGIDDAQNAHDELAEATQLVEGFGENWPATALGERIDGVRDRCVRTLADVRVGHARALADRAETQWETGAYETALDTYDHARAEFEAVAALDPDRHDGADDVEDGLGRIDRAIEELRAAPLQRAIEADRRANEADDPVEATTDWCLAVERYLETLALDAGDPEGRFEGDPEKIRDRVETVMDRILTIARDDGEEALAAGKWFLEAERPAVAREEAGVARDIFEDALAVATETRPEAVDELQRWLDDSEETLAAAAAADGEPADMSDQESADTLDQELAEAASEGDDCGTDDAVNEETPSAEEEASEDAVVRTGTETRRGGSVTAEDDSTSQSVDRPEPPESGVTSSDDRDGVADDEPAGPSLDEFDVPVVGGDADENADETSGERDREATVEEDEDVSGAGVASDEPETMVSDGAGGTTAESATDLSLEIRLRALDPEGFDALARELLAAEGWEPTDAPSDALYDIRGRPTDDATEPVAVWTIHRPIAGPVDVDQITDVGTIATEVEGTAMVVTSSSTTETAARGAREASIRVLDRSDIAAALDGATPDILDRVRPRPE